MELERVLRSQGFGSRPECRALVHAGRVAVAGAICDDPYREIEPEGLTFAVDGVDWPYRKLVYLAFNKPANYECSHKPKHHPSIFSLIPRHFLSRGVQAVGRLDEDTTGLLLLTDDGQFIHQYTSPKKNVPKVYEVTAKHPVSDEQVAALLAGVQLNDEPVPVAAMACERVAERSLLLTVTEGKYHLVKRMIGAAGNRVEALHRISVGSFVLPATLPQGEWAWLETGSP
jgi:16S rRNA pseudouridine516 synthase